MTAEELSAKYSEANWLIVKRSASAAGKALLFGTESLDGVIQEIATVYGLGGEEITHLEPVGDASAMGTVQKAAQSLFGSGADDHASKALQVAKTAIQKGHTANMMATLLKAGPRAAQAAAAGGRVASKGMPWAWVATASYAVGTGGWFAYNARYFNQRAFEFIRERDGIKISAQRELDSTQTVADERFTLEVELPTAAALKTRTIALTDKAGTVVTSLLGKFTARSTNQ